MATIYKGAVGIMNNTLYTDMELIIKNYWGDLSEEKIFPIPLWKLKQLFSAYTSSDVALRVTDIGSKLLVDAQWVIFDEALEAVLQSSTVQPSDIYFVLSDENYSVLRKAASTLAQNLVLITGRIGKTTTTTVIEDETITTVKYYVFFTVCRNEFVKPGGSGDGTSTGFKVPAT